jgi:undecaprenyl-diphosphatase
MQIDVMFNEWMHAIETPWLTNVAEAIAVVTDPYVFAVIAVIIGLFLYFKRLKLEAIFLVGTVAVAGVLLLTLKFLFQRARPLDALIPEIGSTFPSGHAAVTLLFLGLIGYLFLRRQKFVTMVVFPFLILLIGFLRVYPRVHWLTDVLAGYLIGGIILVLGILVYEKIK